MKGRLGKWLAVLLSVSMLAGTAPVYGADISMESDFSSGAAETEAQPDVQEGTEITEEPGDSDVEITEEPETEQPEDAEFSKGEFNGEDQEELVMDGSYDEDSAELTFEDAPSAGENSRKNISRISVCIPAMALRILWRSAAGKIWMKLMAGKPIPLRSDPVIILPDFM